MILFCLFSGCYSKFLIYNESHKIDCKTKIVTFFQYTNFTDFDPLDEFKIAFDLFIDVNFMYVDCRMHLDFCESNNVYTNSIKIINDHKESTFSNSNEFIAFEIVDFVEKTLNVKSKYIKTNLELLDKDNFTDFVLSNHYNLIVFLDMSEKQSQIMKPQIDELAYSFRNDKDIGVGYIDCNKNLQFCLDNNIDAAPIIRAYGNGKPYDYIEERFFHKLLRFSNNIFHKYRKSNGDRNEEYGTIPNILPLVKAFMKKNTKHKIIKQIKAIQDSENYQKITKRILKYGADIIQKDIIKYKHFYKNAYDNNLETDDIKAYLNVISQFEECMPYIPPRENTEL